MSLFNLIPSNEVTMIENYIDAFATTEDMSATRVASVEHILREWDRAKSEYLSNVFQNQLILSKEVVYKKDYEELREEMNTKLWDNSTINELFSKLFEIREKIGWSNDNSKVYYGMSSLLSTSCLVNNVYDGDTFELPIPNSTKTLKISQGAKTLKAIGKIVSAFDLDTEAMETFRIIHSQILNQKALKGQMCISIHPLDYMTMSDNNCDWTSCMSWFENGCYRQGTVEMMNSPMVVVAYLSAKDDMYINGGYWSNKKWREMFIVTPKMITNIKAYPYKNPVLTNIVLDWLKELATAANLGQYDERVTHWSIDDSFEVNDSWYSISPYTRNMYNDFSENQVAYFSQKFYDECKDSYEFCYSGKPECMLCGKLDPDLISENYVVGECCEESYHCDCCGDRMPREYLREIDGAFYCDYCFENNIVEDELTGDLHHEADLLKIYLVDDICKHLFHNRFLYTSEDNLYNKNLTKEFFVGECFRFENWFGHQRYLISLNQLTEKGLKLFGFNSLKEAKRIIENYIKDEYYSLINDDVQEKMTDYLHNQVAIKMTEKAENESEDVLQETS